MRESRKAWADAIRKIMENHGLTLSGMSNKANNVVTKQGIMRWLEGSIPSYERAVAFLRNFPRNEAVDALTAAGYPLPPEWQEPGRQPRYSTEWKDYINSLFEVVSVTKVAAKLNIDAAEIEMWLDGRLPSDMNVVRGLAEILNLDPEELQSNVERWTVSTALKSDYNLTDTELTQVQEVLDRIISQRKNKNINQ